MELAICSRDKRMCRTQYFHSGVSYRMSLYSSDLCTTMTVAKSGVETYSISDSFQKISQAWQYSIQDSTILSFLFYREGFQEGASSFFTLKYFSVKLEACSDRSGLLRITHYCSELPRKMEG